MEYSDKETQFFPLPSRVLSQELHKWWWGSRMNGWETSSQGVEHRKRDKDLIPTNCITDSVKRLTYELLGQLVYRFPHLAHCHPQHFVYLMNTQPHPMVGSLCRVLMMVRVSLGRRAESHPFLLAGRNYKLDSI